MGFMISRLIGKSFCWSSELEVALARFEGLVQFIVAAEAFGHFATPS